jgi:hypothetical protein
LHIVEVAHTDFTEITLGIRSGAIQRMIRVFHEGIGGR